MRITIEVDDADVANEVAESLRHEAESIGIVHPGTADMLRGVADQIEAQIEAPTLPFIMQANDYHAFEDQKRVLDQVIGSVRYKELDLDSAPYYLAVFFIDQCPEVTEDNINSFRKVEA